MTNIPPDLAHHSERTRSEAEARRALIRLAELQAEADQASAAYLAFLAPSAWSGECARLLKLSVDTALRLDTAREEYRRLGSVSL